MTAKRKTDPITAPLEPGTGITAENYTVRAKAFVSLSPDRRGTVIRSFHGAKGAQLTKEPATDAQWIAWLRYFAHKGIPHRFIIAHGLATVPAEWPELFDAEAPISDRGRVLDRPPMSALSFGGRRNMGGELAEKLESLGSRKRL